MWRASAAVRGSRMRAVRGGAPSTAAAAAAATTAKTAAATAAAAATTATTTAATTAAATAAATAAMRAIRGVWAVGAAGASYAGCSYAGCFAAHHVQRRAARRQRSLERNAVRAVPSRRRAVHGAVRAVHELAKFGAGVKAARP